MHELSIAYSIIDIAESEARKANAKSIKSIELEIGKLAGIEYESLEFALQAAIQSTMLEHATIEVDKPDGRAKCNACNQEFIITQLFEQCPVCQGYNLNIIRGKELRVKSLIVE
jgi:hydrogenase nickel incorporation protein HypA/HybF